MRVRPARSLSLAATTAIVSFVACARPAVVSSPASTPSAAPPPAGLVTGELPLKLAPRPTASAITPADLMTRVYIFADDSMGGRQVGTIYNGKGTDYIAQELRRAGLKPAGANGTFFQDVPVMEHTFSPASSITVDGTRFAGGTDFYARDPRAFDPSIAARSIDGSQVVYAGSTGTPSTLMPPTQTAGKFVILTVPVVNGKPDWTGKRQQASITYRNAAAVAIVALESITPPERQQFFLPEQVYSSRAADTFPVFMYVTTAMAETLLGAPLAAVRPGAAGRTVRGTVTYTMRQLPARNVVAIVEGSDPALRSQYVAVGAHNDHVGFGPAPVDHDSLRAYLTVVQPKGADDPPRPPTAAEAVRINQIKDSLRRVRPMVRRDSINNGADDDASGSMAVLEMAQAFAAAPVKPKRSIIFVWHTGEEAGLWGSDYFTEHPTVPRESIVAQINMDMVGRGGAQDLAGGGPGYAQVIGSRRLSTELGAIVDAVGARQPVPFKFDYSFDADGHPQNYYCRSDHYNYARFGIPIAFFSTGGHRDYHQLTDEPQYVDYNQLARVANMAYDVVSTVANLDHRVVVDKPKPNPYGQCRQ
jgi:hypothetical protein